MAVVRRSLLVTSRRKFPPMLWKILPLGQRKMFEWNPSRVQKTNSTGSNSQVNMSPFKKLKQFIYLSEKKVLPGIVLTFFFGYSAMAGFFYLGED